jgi:hypothetical protein
MPGISKARVNVGGPLWLNSFAAMEFAITASALARG